MTTATVAHKVHTDAVEIQVTDRAVVYTWEEAGKFVAKAYVGNQTKHAFFFAWGTEQKRAAYVEQWTWGQKRAEEVRSTRMAAQKAARAAVDVAVQYPIGTVLVHSFGWEQTNIDFYKVIGHTGRTRVKLAKLEAVITEVGFQSMAGNSVPVESVKDGCEIVLATARNGDEVILPHAKNYTFGKTASKWDGKPRYTSWYA